MAEILSDIPKESSRTILFQFVVFPLGVVLVAVGVFFLFGRLATDEREIPDHLSDIRSGSRHQRWQAAYQLSKSLKRGEAKRYPNLQQQVASLYVSAEHDDPRIRQYLSLVLGNLGDRQSTPLLIGALQDREVENRIYALIALSQLRDPAAVPAISRVAADDDKDVRKTALYALGEIGDRRAVPALSNGVSDQIPEVRFNAAIALSRFGDSRAIGPLREMTDRATLDRIEGMRPDQKEDAIVVAIGPYARIAGAEARPRLELLARDTSVRVQQAAKAALGRR